MILRRSAARALARLRLRAHVRFPACPASRSRSSPARRSISSRSASRRSRSGVTAMRPSATAFVSVPGSSSEPGSTPRCGTCGGRPARRAARARRRRSLADRCDLDAARLAGRDVDVEQRPAADGHRVELVDEVGDEARGGGEVEVALAALLGDRDRRQAEHDALEGGGDRARVGDVVGQVRAVVDAGDDELRREAVDKARARPAGRSRSASRRSGSRGCRRRSRRARP